MTIEEKVREIILYLYIDADDNLFKGLRHFDSGDGCRVDRTAQAILDLMKPTSRALVNLSAKVRAYADIGNKQFNQDEDEFWSMAEANDKAEAILKEWENK